MRGPTPGQLRRSNAQEVVTMLEASRGRLATANIKLLERLKGDGFDAAFVVWMKQTLDVLRKPRVYQSIMGAVILFMVFTLVPERGHDREPVRKIRSTVTDMHIDKKHIHGISARVGEVEFFRLSLGHNRNGQPTVEFIHSAPEEDITILEHDSDQKSKYPDQLLQKIKEKDSDQYRLKSIDLAEMKMEGRELLWWGYNRTHEFLIDKAKLDKLDINSLNIAENLEAKFGKPPGTSTIQKGQVGTQIVSPVEAILSWDTKSYNKVKTTVNPSGILFMSVFGGELRTVEDYFDAHDGVLYQYEPLRIIGEGCASANVPKKVTHLHDLFSCKYDNLSKAITDFNAREAKHAGVVSGGFPFRAKSSRLCKSEFCEGHDFSQNEDKCTKKCPNVELSMIESLCHSKLPAIKVVRICSLTSLTHLMPGNALKVIMFVRDPRAIAYQRGTTAFKSWASDQLINNIKWMCLDTAKSINLALGKNSQHASWLDNRLMILRAEDVLQNTTFWFDQILQFAKLQTEAEKNKVAAAYKEYLKNSVNFKRERETLFTWRTQYAVPSNFGYETIQGIEKVCSEMMELAGYTKSTEEADIDNLTKKLHR